MLKLVSYSLCPYVQKAAAALELKNVKYETEFIQLNEKPEWFLKISPAGKVPVLILEDGTPLFESSAISEYIEEVYSAEPRLLPQSPVQRALIRAWAEQAALASTYAYQLNRAKNQEYFDRAKANYRRSFEKLEEAINNGAPLAGENYNLADLAWLPMVHRTYLIMKVTGFDFMEGLEKCSAWREKLMNDETLKKSVPPDFEKQFRGYVSMMETSFKP